MIESIYLQGLVSILFAYLIVVLFDWFNLRKLVIFPSGRIWIIIFVLAIPCFFVINGLNQTGITSHIDYSDNNQSLPNYLMFFATLLSVYLLYKALISQQRATQLTSFESRFFRFMDYHRENVNLLKYRDPKDAKERYWEGNQVFTVIYYEIKDLLNKVKNKEDNNGFADNASIINFVYQCVFYGAGEDGRRILERKFKDAAFEDLDFLNKTAAYSNDQKYFSGHVRRLGHYFRNIYQAIQYVEKQNFLTEQEKYRYVSHLRAQMSVYEQAVFFFNSLSDLGKVWEWERYNNTLPNDIESRRKIFRKLFVTKYDLIRNTLTDDGFIVDGISLKHFYPLINLERTDECSVSGMLPFRGSKMFLCRLCFNEHYIGYKNNKSDISEEIDAYLRNAPYDELARFKCDEPQCLVKPSLSGRVGQATR